MFRLFGSVALGKNNAREHVTVFKLPAKLCSVIDQMDTGMTSLVCNLIRMTEVITCTLYMLCYYMVKEHVYIFLKDISSKVLIHFLFLFCFHSYAVTPRGVTNLCKGPNFDHS